jgi:hypothetical protein
MHHLFLANAGGNFATTPGYLRTNLMMFEGLYAMATDVVMRTNAQFLEQAV